MALPAQRGKLASARRQGRPLAEHAEHKREHDADRTRDKADGSVQDPSGPVSTASRRRLSWISVVRAWMARVSSVLVLSSCSCSTKSWSALACWNAAWRFCPIITNVDRKIASSDTTSVSFGHGLGSTNTIQTAKATAWM